MSASHRKARTALITGAAGQDGRLLTSLLLGQGYEVFGIVRPGTAMAFQPRLRVIEADLLEMGLFGQLIPEVRPDEVYHLAAHHRSAQESCAEYDVLVDFGKMVDTNFGTCHSLAMAIMKSGVQARLVFAASSQMYTASAEMTCVDECSVRNPTTTYGYVKSWSTELLGLLRRDSGLHASVAIMFNHESSLRHPKFVSRKISMAAAAAAAGQSVSLELMNIGSRVDWSAAEDVVAALQIMAGADTPQDFVVSSGLLHSIRDLLNVAFSHVNLDWRDYATFKCDVLEPSLCGNSMRVRELGWQPQTNFKTWVCRMVDHDLSMQCQH